MAPVSEVARDKHFSPLLIWGWLRKRGMTEVGGRGERVGEEEEETVKREREEWRQRGAHEGGLLEYPVYLWSERQNKEGRMKGRPRRSRRKRKMRN